MPAASVFYWKSLTFLDPLDGLILFIKPRLGIAMLVTIMVTDVTLNSMIQRTYGGDPSRLIEKVTFLMFVFATCQFVWRVTTDMVGHHRIDTGQERLKDL